MRTTLRLLNTALLLVLCLDGLAQSVPRLMNYQGQLLDASGTSLPTADYEIEVRLFPVAAGGAAIWGPQVFNGQSGVGFSPKVTVVQGRFNLVLGPQDTQTNDLADVFATHGNAYLELKVGAASPITPRQQILAAPYALMSDSAANAALLGGFGWEAVFPDTGRPDTGHLPDSRIADGAITTSKIAANAVGTSQVTNGAITASKLDLQTGRVAIGMASASYPLDVLSTNAGAAIHAANSAGVGAHAVWLAEATTAMYAVGNVIVQGNLTKSSGSFRIDHPLDPANRYLYHSFVESPDMKNIYDGVAVLDDQGEAVIELPAWFEALNQEFRYQLTAIGGPGPNLHVSQEIAKGRFKIGGGTRRMKVSWQVTGIRHDAYANAHRIPVEEDKPPALRGYYLHPEEQQMPASKNVRAAMRPGNDSPR